MQIGWLDCVVSAQGQGLLCEVPRSAKDDNVKYIGYCSNHYKKMVCALCTSFAFISLTLLGAHQEGYSAFKKSCYSSV